MLKIIDLNKEYRTGARALKGVSFEVDLPQVLPRYLGVSIYRLDAIIRHSTVVGIVGAGGIGILLYSSINFCGRKLP